MNLLQLLIYKLIYEDLLLLQNIYNIHILIQPEIISEHNISSSLNGDWKMEENITIHY